MKRFVFIFFLIVFLLPFSVSAEEGNWQKQTEIIDVEELEGLLDDNVREFFEQNGIDAADYNWVNSLSGENVFSHIFSFIRGGIKKPIRAFTAIFGIILIVSAITAFGTNEKRFQSAIFASVLAVCAVISGEVAALISAAQNALRGSASFMLGFIPIFALAVAFSGGAVTAASMSALLLGAAEAVSYIASFGITALMGGYLSISVASSVSPLINTNGISEGVRKLSVWIMSLVSTVFLGILSIQTVVNSAADTLTTRTAKFIIGTSVPVAGAALSEAVSTVSASMSLLRSSVGIYAVVALVVIFLPIIIEILIWRLGLMLLSGTAEMFSLIKIKGVLRSVDTVLSILLGVLLLVGAMFIISLTVVVTATGKIQ